MQSLKEQEEQGKERKQRTYEQQDPLGSTDQRTERGGKERRGFKKE